jgi:drug/metabolite transporter (DMT)-like permease
VPLSALLLTLGAAALHAFWNLLVAGSRDPVPLTAAMLATSVVLFAPAAALTWDVSWKAAPYVAASAALELVYFVLLATAYRTYELSLVYPIARGLAPVLVLVVTVAALAFRPGVVQAAGVLVVAGGVALVRGVRRAADLRGVALAVGVGACIAGYTIVDQEGLEHAAPLSYFELVACIATALFVAWVIGSRGVAPVRAVVGPRAVVAGVAGFVAYLLVLAALERAPAALVAAVRESSILIATVLAAVVLHEHVTRARLTGCVLIVTGVAMIALS